MRWNQKMPQYSQKYYFPQHFLVNLRTKSIGASVLEQCGFGKSTAPIMGDLIQLAVVVLLHQRINWNLVFFYFLFWSFSDFDLEKKLARLLPNSKFNK